MLVRDGKKSTSRVNTVCEGEGNSWLQFSQLLFVW